MADTGIPSKSQGNQGLGVISPELSCFDKSYESAVALVPKICQFRRRAARGGRARILV
jgi:hypothetical protein